MSYDLYCYRSSIGRPDPNEAKEVIRAESDSAPPTLEERGKMNAIADQLVAFDPRLEVFQFDYQKIADSKSISLEDARDSIHYVELNTPVDDEYYIQFSILKDHVSISFGFGMPDDFLVRVMAYVDEICRKTGYFLYDPQDGSAVDPLHIIPLSDDEKKSRFKSDDVDFLKEEKPWWKFW